MLTKLCFTGILLLIGLCNFNLVAQPPSALQGMLTNISLIERSAEFNELQFNLDKQLAETEPGVRMDYVFDRIQTFKQQVLAQFTAPQFHLNAADRTAELTWNIGIGTPDSTITWKLAEPDKMDKLIDDLFKDLKFSELQVQGCDVCDNATTKALVTALITLLPPAAKDFILKTDTLDSCLKKILKSFKEDLKNKIKEKAVLPLDTAQYPAIENSINELLEDVAGRFREGISNAFNSVQDEITRAVASASDLLVSGNAGLAVLESKGSITGGMGVTYVFDKNIGIGVFVGHQLNPGVEAETIAEPAISSVDSLSGNESADQSRSLIGARFMVASEGLQLDLLFSYFHPLNDTGKSWELGGGISTSCIKNLVLGIAVFEQAGLSSTATGFATTMGITIKVSNPVWPSLQVGAIVPTSFEHSFDELFEKRSTARPFLELVYPISFTR